MPLRLLLLPGYACTSQIWQPVQSILAAEFDITLVDWPQALLPGFHRLDDFAGWLSRQYALARFDCLAGHSMGGLVALKALASAGLEHPRLLLVESFLAPPGPFFQNLLMPDAPPALVGQVQDMLQRQRALYAPDLAGSLREVQMAEVALQAKASLGAIYGDRGSGDLAQVTRALAWPGALVERVPVSLVPDSCHFPMWEQPGPMARILRQVCPAE